MQRFLKRVIPSAPFISKGSPLKPFSNFPFNTRSFSSTNDSDSSNENSSSDSQALVKGGETQIAKTHPFFTDKAGVITFVVDYPLFPMAKYSINLDEAKFKV